MRFLSLIFLLFFELCFTQEQVFWNKKQDIKVEIDFLFDKKEVQLIWEIEKKSKSNLLLWQQKWKDNEKFIIFLFKKNKIYLTLKADGFDVSLKGKGIELKENYTMLKPFFWVSSQSRWRLTWTPDELPDHIWCSELLIEEKNKKTYLILTIYFQEFRDRNDFRSMNFAPIFLRLFQQTILELLQFF